MFAYTFRRLLITIPTLLVVIGVVYILLFSAPGGPFDSERVVPEAIQAQLMAKYHLDLPYWKQYLLYIGQLLQGDLGVDVWSKRPVLDQIAEAFPHTLILGIVALGWALVLGIALGVISVVYQGRWVDRVLGVVSVGFISVPSKGLCRRLALTGSWAKKRARLNFLTLSPLQKKGSNM